MNEALAGIRILDFSQMMMGPWATQLLGDLGADVIKVERPEVGEWERSLAAMGQFLNGESPFFLSMNRNKRSLTLDLKHPEARRIVDDLIPKVDVVVENFRPGVMDRLGFGFERLSALNSTSGLLLGQRLRLGWSVRQTTRPGPSHPGSEWIGCQYRKSR